MANSLVDNLRPVAKDQVKLRDRVIRATVSGPEQTARGNSTVIQWDMAAYASFCITLAGDSSQWAVDGSNDLNAWFPIDMQPLSASQNAPIDINFFQENVAFAGSTPTTNIAANKQSRFVRVRSAAASTGRNSIVTVTLSQTPFVPTRPVKHLGPGNSWSYAAAAGGITTTAPVSVRSATNPYHRSLVTQAEFSNGGTTGAEVSILDGSTVMWRAWVAPDGIVSASFDPPLRGSVSAAVNVAISASSGAAIYANLRGLTALG